MMESRMCIGTCSLCGGRVSVHQGPWMSIVPPTANCESCGAEKAEHGPVVEMCKRVAVGRGRVVYLSHTTTGSYLVFNR